MEEQEKKKNGINEPDLVNENKTNIVAYRKRRCPNCKEIIEDKGDVCPHCRHYLDEKRVSYQPLDKKTAKKIRWILSGVLLLVFATLVMFGVIDVPACSS